MEKKFFADKIEKAEINILQKEWEKKAFLLFKIKRKTITSNKNLLPVVTCNVCTLQTVFF